MMEILISVVIPTLNRKNYLVDTLAHLIPQLERNATKVELLVCNNASDDDTDIYLKDVVANHPLVQYYYYSNRVEIWDSFSRSIDRCNGKYVIIWGDDDLPAPFLVETLLEAISHGNHPGLVHFNRVVGYDAKPAMNSLKVNNTRYDQPVTRYNLNDFIVHHFLDATFISSLLFLKGGWQKGRSFDTSTHYGYEFLGVIYSGLKGKDCIYLAFPLCIQRKPLTRIWASQWPLYSLVGTPNMMRDFGKEGIMVDGLHYWENNVNNSLVIFVYTLLWAAAYKGIYRNKCREINAYQKSYFRKALTYCVIYLAPSFTFGVVRKLFFRAKNQA